MNMLRIPTRINVNKYLLFGVFPLIFGSCQTMALYTFESLKAPKIIVPPDVKTIGFVDRNLSFDSDSLSEYYQSNALTVKDTANYDKIRAINCHLGLSENLSNYYALDSISFTRFSIKHIEGERKYDPMTWEQVDSVCESSGSDIIICLEDLQIFNEYETIKGEENWGITDIRYYAVWRIYDPLLQKLHDERMISDSLYTEVSSYSFTKLIEDKMPTRKELNAEVSYEVGRNYANLISPTWEELTRTYFIAGHEDFSLAYYYLSNENLNQAIEMWKKHTNSVDLKIAGRACYNLAMAYELKEDFQKANVWIQKSIKYYQDLDKEPSEYKFIKEYYKELTQRIQNSYLLDKFFGKEKTK